MKTIEIGDDDFAIVISKRTTAEGDLRPPRTPIYACGKQLGLVQSLTIEVAVGEVMPKVVLTYPPLDIIPTDVAGRLKPIVDAVRALGFVEVQGFDTPPDPAE